MNIGVQQSIWFVSNSKTNTNADKRYNHRYKYNYRGSVGDAEVATGDRSPLTIYLVCCIYIKVHI